MNGFDIFAIAIIILISIIIIDSAFWRCTGMLKQ